MSENLRENIKKINKKSKIKKKIKISKLFLYATSNSFYLFLFFDIKIQ